jgi:uncharacterized RDD family membrane protein YckC
MSTVKITTSQNIELDYELASLGERMLAYLLDALIILAYIILLALVVFNLYTTNGNEQVYLFLLLPVAFYSLLSEIFMNGQSVGKKVLKIKVISLDGGNATFGQYLLRWVFRLLDISMTSGLGAIISIAITERAQRIGDLVAGTTLIKTVPRTTLQQTLYVPNPQQDYQVSFPEVETLSDADMQLIKEVILNVRRSGNTMLALHAAEKIEARLQISRGQAEPQYFLLTLLSDYNYLTSRQAN